MFIKTGMHGLDELIPGFPEGEIILVAGRPGTGKTIFSASFLYNGAVKYGDKGLYISLGEDRESFLHNMSELGYDFEALEEKGLFEFEEILTLREEASKALLAELLSYIEEAQPKRLVIDSFSALVQNFDDPREIRVFLHSLFTRVVKRLRCTTILVEEIPYGASKIGYGFEEFIASGIIILRSRFQDGRIYREILVPKLRGAEIKNPVTCFTLHKGFKAFPPWKPVESEIRKPYQPIPEPAQSFSTGISELDKALGGGLAHGSILLLELDPEITYEQYHLILNPIVFNYVLASQRPCIIIPSAGVSWEDVLDTFTSFGFTQDEIKKFVRIIEPVKELREKYPNEVIKWYPESPEKDFEKIAELEEALKKSTDRFPLKVIGIDRVAHYHGVEGTVTFANLDVTRTRKLKSLTIWLFKNVYPEILRRLVPLSTVHLKLIKKNGCLLLYGLKPRTPFYAVEQDLSKGYPSPKLVLIE